MATLTQEERAIRRAQRWRAFFRSTYITWFEEWLMGFLGRLVNIILIVTILYSCAEIYVSLPAGVNLTMFLIQMAALDIGGYGLTTLARAARRDGDTDGANKADWLGRGLFGVMIISVVIAGLEQKVTIPDAVKTGIDLTLIVIRSASSVLYGRVVHALKSEHEVEQPAQPPMPTPAPVDIANVVEQAVQNAMQQLPPVPSLDMESVLETVTARFETRLQGQMEAWRTQQVTVSPAMETRHIAAPETVSEPIIEGVSRTVSKPAKKRVSSRHKKPARQARKTTRIEDDETVISGLLDEDQSRSHRVLSSMTGIPESTAYRLRKRYFETHQRNTVSSEPEEQPKAQDETAI